MHDFDGDLIITDLMPLAVHGWNWSNISLAGGSSVDVSPPPDARPPHCSRLRFEETGKLLSCWAVFQHFFSVNNLFQQESEHY